jgi:hypothetical protein
VLDKTCIWHRYAVAGLLRVSTEALKAEGAKWLKPTLLDRLEKRKLISRGNNPLDRRSWVVEILPEGRRTAEKLRRVLEKLEREVVGGVTQADLESFGRVMESVARVTAVDVRGRKPTSS